MTTLYKPVLIESAEQAEALPVGTVAILGWGLGSDIRTRTSNGWITRAGSVLPSADVVGWTALAPIEAEEEHVAPDAGTYSRYVTAWEEA